MSHSMLPTRNSFKIWSYRNAENKKVKITLPPNFSNVKVGKWASDKADFINRISNITWQQKFHNNTLFPHSQNNNESDTNLKLMQSEGNK